MITGRAVLLCLAGAVVTALSPWPGRTALGWLAFLALVCLLDWLLAGAAG